MFLACPPMFRRALPAVVVRGAPDARAAESGLHVAARAARPATLCRITEDSIFRCGWQRCYRSLLAILLGATRRSVEDREIVTCKAQVSMQLRYSLESCDPTHERQSLSPLRSSHTSVIYQINGNESRRRSGNPKQKIRRNQAWKYTQEQGHKGESPATNLQSTLRCSRWKDSRQPTRKHHKTRTEL